MNLILGDCVEKLKELQEGSVDLTVTSPPYDNLRTYEGDLQWGEHIWKEVFVQLYRVTKKGGVVVWVVGDATINGSESGTSFKQALWAKECGFNLHDTMIYQKAGTGACGSNLSYWQSFEYMFVFSKGKPTTINRIQDQVNARAGTVCTRGRVAKNGAEKDLARRVIPAMSVRTNVWRFLAGNNGDDKVSHPAKFPEALASDHIKSWSSVGDLILDPFMGSGTTGAMAKRHGRRFIGIEKVEKYFEVAKARIEAA